MQKVKLDGFFILERPMSILKINPCFGENETTQRRHGKAEEYINDITNLFFIKPFLVGIQHGVNKNPN